MEPQPIVIPQNEIIKTDEIYYITKTKKSNPTDPTDPTDPIEATAETKCENITSPTKYDRFWEKNNDKKPSQLERYKKHNSPIGIQKFIEIGGGPKMGTTLEKFAREEFPCLQKRDKGKNTGYDHKITVASKDIYVEQKSSGHWGEHDYKWQHIEDKHKWHILLLCGIDYDEIKFWVMNREVFARLIEEKKITNQGNNTGESSEGMWFNYSDVEDSLIEIKTNEDLTQYVTTTEINTITQTI
jgi:hypothetical protein